MNVLLDANVWISALVWQGQCGAVLDRCRNRHVLLTSERILREVRRGMSEKAGFDQTPIEIATAFIRSVSVMVSASSLREPVCRDPDDDHVLAVAVAGEADCIVTGDRDLLVLGEFQGISVLSPAAFWPFETERGEADDA